MSKGFDVEQLRLPSEQLTHTKVVRSAFSDRPATPDSGNKLLPRHKKGEHFLKGPVPLIWLAQAARCGGKALHVAIILWYRAGLQKSATIKIPGWTAKRFGLDRHAKTRALKALEEAGLVSVTRRQGCSPQVTLLEYKQAPPE
jgi:DNA-binding transcriptional ArsR family regulator